MNKDQILRLLIKANSYVSDAATGEAKLIDIMPALMEASDLLDDAIGGIEDHLVDKQKDLNEE